MNTLEQRYQPILEQMRSEKRSVAENRNFLKSQRCGDYLIKVSKNNKRNWCGEDQKYIDYTYTQKGWFSLCCRKNAQWFSGVEAQEFIKGKQGFTIVRK
jgi:hypothetical protein